MTPHFMCGIFIIGSYQKILFPWNRSQRRQSAKYGSKEILAFCSKVSAVFHFKEIGFFLSSHNKNSTYKMNIITKK